MLWDDSLHCCLLLGLFNDAFLTTYVIYLATLCYIYFHFRCGAKDGSNWQWVPQL